MKVRYAVLVINWPVDWHPEGLHDEPPVYRVIRVGYASLQEREARDAAKLFNELQLGGERRLWSVCKRQSFTGR